MKKLTFLTVLVLILAAFNEASGQNLKLNDLEYFETQGVNVLVYSNIFQLFVSNSGGSSSSESGVLWK